MRRGARGLAMVAGRAAHAQEWPAFRGPDGQGHSSERGLPAEWSESKNVVWKAPVPGMGWSSPVVAGGRVWLTTAVDEGDIVLRVLAFDVEQGREVVNVELFRLKNAREISPKNSFASPTPVLEADRVYVHFGADGTAALTTSGEVVWKTKLSYQSQHGAGGSPILYGDLLIVSCDGHDAAYVVALDKRTGKARWKTNRRQPADQAYTTPLVIRVGDRDQVVSVGAYRAAAYDPMTGREIWRVSYGGWILERAATGLWSWSGLHRDRISGAVPDGRSCRWDRRCDQNACRLDPASRRTVDAVTVAGGRRALRRDGWRHRLMPGCEHRRHPLANAAGRHIFRVTGIR